MPLLVPHAQPDTQHLTPQPLGLLGSPRVPGGGCGRRQPLGQRQHSADLHWGSEGGLPLWRELEGKPSLAKDTVTRWVRLTPGPFPDSQLWVSGAHGLGFNPQAKPRWVGQVLRGAGPRAGGRCWGLFKTQMACALPSRVCGGSCQAGKTRLRHPRGTPPKGDTATRQSSSSRVGPDPTASPSGPVFPSLPLRGTSQPPPRGGRRNTHWLSPRPVPSRTVTQTHRPHCHSMSPATARTPSQVSDKLPVTLDPAGHHTELSPEARRQTHADRAHVRAQHDHL